MNRKAQIFDMEWEHVIIIVLAVITTTSLALLIYNHSQDNEQLTLDRCIQSVNSDLVTFKLNQSCPQELIAVDSNRTIQYYMNCVTNNNQSSNITIFLKKSTLGDGDTIFKLYSPTSNISYGTKSGIKYINTTNSTK